MKRFVAVWTLLLILSVSAVADNTEMLFRALCCMDKTGNLWDHAARASVISGVRLRENGGVYSGKIHLNKATYTMIVEQEEDGGVTLSFDVRDTASRWSTDGVVARKFDKAMTELFLSPVNERLWDPEDESYDKPVPRIQSGALNLQKIGEKRKPFLVEWKNNKGTITARLTGQKTYRECRYRLTLWFSSDTAGQADTGMSGTGKREMQDRPIRPEDSTEWDEEVNGEELDDPITSFEGDEYDEQYDDEDDESYDEIWNDEEEA